MMPLGGKKGNCTAKMHNDDACLPPMMHHLSYLEKLGKVRATRVVATSVDGETGLSNREKSIEIGNCNCYKHYMTMLEHEVSCKVNGATIVVGQNGKPVEHGYFSF